MKMNNKGFTLIELLAVIVILAIIMVVTIPTVLNSMGNARKSTFQTSANTVADWVEKEYSLAQLDMADDAFLGVCNNNDSISLYGNQKGNGNDYCQGRPYNSNYMVTHNKDNVDGFKKKLTSYNESQDNTDALAKMLRAAGVNPDNYGFVRIKITDGRACVHLSASDTGDFKQYVMTTKNFETDSNVAKSTGCN